MKKYLLISLLFFSCFLTLLIGFLTKSNYIQLIDQKFFTLIHSFRNKYLDYWFVSFSYLGESISVVIFCLILLILPNRRRIGLPVSLITGFSALINAIIKNIIQRPRPDLSHFFYNPNINYEFPSSYSFPSGHSQTSYLFFIVLTLFILLEYSKIKKIIMPLIFASWLLFANIVLSRIYIGVHYPTDCIAGASLCFTIYFLVLGFVNNYPFSRYVNVIIDRKKGSNDPYFKSIVYQEDFGYITNFYKRDNKMQRCYVLDNVNNKDTLAVKLVAYVIRQDDINNLYVAVPKRRKIKKAEIKKRIEFIEKDFDYKVKML